MSADAPDLSQALVSALSRQAIVSWSEELAGLAVYPGNDVPVGSARQKGRLADVFASPAALQDAARSEVPGALHAGLLVLSKVDETGARDVARVCLTRPRFNLLDVLAVQLLKPSARDPSILQLFFERVIRSPEVTDSSCFVTLLTDEDLESLASPARQKHEAELEAAEAAVDTWEEACVVRPLVGVLGTSHHKGSFDLLVRLHTSHRSTNLRMAAGHALVALGTTDALEPLVGRLRVRDRAASFFAVKAAFALSAATAFERLDLGRPLSTRAAVELLRCLKLVDAGFAADQRWAALLARWTRNDVLTDSATALLDKFQPKDRQAALAGVELQEVTRQADQSAVILPQVEELASWLTRYEAGEYDEIWRLLQALGAQIQNERVAPYALAIAKATMARVRRRVERIVDVLTNAGYHFAQNVPPWTPPAKNVDAALKKLQKLVGPVPLSLAEFYRQVGSVVLAGGHADWPKTHTEQLAPKEKVDVYSDPLVVWSLGSVLDDAGDFKGAGRFPVPVWSDPLGKAGYSAGGCIVYAKDPSADAPVLGDPAGRTFLQCLRHSIAHGGFPGFADKPPDLLRALCQPADF